jgi:diguanylate cyclase (GGDEF)-like protein
VADNAPPFTIGWTATLRAWTRDWGGLLALGLLPYVALFALWSWVGWGDESARTLVGDLACLPPSLVVALLAWRAARRPVSDRPSARAWGLLAAAVLAYFLGDLVWFHIEIVLGLQPFPSWADVGYLAFYPLALAGLLSFPGALRGHEQRARLALDTLTVVLGGSLLVWYFLLRPMALAEGAEPLAIALSTGYAVGDLALLFGVVGLLLRRPAAGRRGALALLIVGLSLFFVADLAFAWLNVQGAYHSGDWPDSLWIGALACMALGAQVERVRVGRSPAGVPDEEAGPTWTRWLPYAAIAASVVLLLVVARDQALAPLGELIGGVAALVGLIVGRQFLVLRENARLARQQAALVAEMAHRAAHDALTGLPNRVLLRERLAAALGRAGGGGAALLYLDLDNFKVVNDSRGHQAGDRLLVGVARRLRAAVRPADMVARLGGDEFTILLTERADMAAAMAVAERVAAALQTPFSVDGREFFASTSIGIAVSGPALNEPDDLLRAADTALYRAKRLGKGCAQTYDPSLQAEAERRLALEHDLRRALARGEFQVHYQPVVDLATGAVREVEALVRWRHPERGLVAPAEFLPVADETGLIVPIGQFVLDEACRQVMHWQAEFPSEPPLGLAVNVSAREFRRPTLVVDIMRVLLTTGLPPSSLMLEITESSMMENAEATLAMLRELKALGVRLAVDDFGTGYSSLAYLKRFPVDALKVDRAFVRGLEQDHEDQALVSAMVAAADALRLTVVAEGIETAAQVELLRRRGCGLGQGFYFARPGDGAAIGAVVAARGRRAATTGD